MQKLVLPEVESGVILVRSDDEIATNIRSYTLCFKDSLLIGFCALHVHTEYLAETRSLIVKDGFDLGQKWVDVTSERALDVGFTNNTNKPIEMAITVFKTTSARFGFLMFIDDSRTASSAMSPNSSTTASYISGTYTIPPGSAYKANNVDDGALYEWKELR